MFSNSSHIFSPKKYLELLWWAILMDQCWTFGWWMCRWTMDADWSQTTGSGSCESNRMAGWASAGETGGLLLLEGGGFARWVSAGRRRTAAAAAAQAKSRGGRKISASKEKSTGSGRQRRRKFARGYRSLGAAGSWGVQIGHCWRHTFQV